MVICNTITAKAMGLSENVRMVNAPLRQRLGLSTICGREVIDTRSQATNLRLQGDAMLAQLSSHSIPMNRSLGVWFFEQGSTRFHTGYKTVEDMCGGDKKGSDKWVEMVFSRAADMEKLVGGNISLQAHYPNEINAGNVAKWVQMMQQTGIGVDSLVPFLFGPKEYQHNSLCNPNKETRQQARQVQLETFQMADVIGVPTVNHWFGIDGFENVFGVNISWMLDQIEGSTADAMLAVPGQQATEEPKPYEPRANNIMALTHDGLLIARGIEERLMLRGNDTLKGLLGQGIRMVGMTPEIGHMQMAYEVLAKSFEQVMRESRLFCIHWNGQPLGNYDVDGNVGLSNYETLDQVAYVLQRAGYKGVNTLDINPLRMDLEDAVLISFLNLSAAFNQARAWDHGLVWKAVNNPENNGNAVVELIQLANRRPGTPEAAQAMARVAELAGRLQEPQLG